MSMCRLTRYNDNHQLTLSENIRCVKKTWDIISDHKSPVSWSNCTVFVPLKTAMKTLKIKVVLYSLPSVGSRADPGVQAVSLRVTFKSSSAVGCHYFPPGFRSPSKPKNVIVLQPVLSYTVWWRRHIGVNNFPKVVTQLCRSGNWTHDPLSLKLRTPPSNLLSNLSC